MKTIILTQSLVNELERCDRSFIMSLYHRDKDNKHIKTHRITPVSRSDVKERQLKLIEKCVNPTGSTPLFRVSTGRDVTLKQRVEETKELFTLCEEAIIYSPMFASGNIVIGADLAVVKGNGSIDVYHMSIKNFLNGSRPTPEASRADALNDVGPLLGVLKKFEGYSFRVFVSGITGQFNTPYPDPVTGSFKYDTSEALYVIEFTTDDEDVCEYLDGLTPMKKVRQLMKNIREDAEWIPDATIGSQCQCSGTNPCPFTEYCQSQLPTNHVRFHLPYHDMKKCLDNGVETMDDLLELSYTFLGLSNIPSADGSKKTWTLSEIALRELQTYERLAS